MKVPTCKFFTFEIFFYFINIKAFRADDDDDAKALRAAYHRAKRGNGGGGQRVIRRGRGGGGAGRYGGYGSPYAMGMGGMGGQQMCFPNLAGMGYSLPAAPQPPPQFPQYGGNQMRFQSRGPPSIKTCYKCGIPGHLKDSCPNGPPRV